jgi:branched-subunit amino acid ABC-type transport system permease component
LVVPIFHLQPISILGAVTLSLIVGFLTRHDNNCARDTDKSFAATSMSNAFVYPLIVLLFAWVAKGFI